MVRTGALAKVSMAVPSGALALRLTTEPFATMLLGAAPPVATVTVRLLLTLPGANATDAAPSGLVAEPPAVAVTRDVPGGEGPLPGVDAGSNGGKTALWGVLVVPEGCAELVVAGVVEVVPPDGDPPVEVVPAAFCVSWLPGVPEVPPVGLCAVPEEVTE